MELNDDMGGFSFMNFKENKSDLMGCSLLILSILLFGVLAFLAIKYLFISNDEWYTMGIINLSLPNMLQVTAGDVHPPMFYLILYGFIFLFKLFSINIDLVYIMKITAMTPYVILLVVSLTKIRKDYGLLSAGIFSFTIIAMCNFFTYYLIARMYSWPLLFLILAFIYLKDVIEKGDLKYWILLSLFSVLGAYGHYFAAIPLIIIYLALFIYLLTKRDEDSFKPQLKKYLISAILAILCYLPWSFILLNQINQVHNSYHIRTLTLNKIIECTAYYLSISGNYFIQIGACIAIAVVFLILIWKYYNTRKDDDFHTFLGVFAFVATICFALIVSFAYKPILTPRYLLPVSGLVWLTVSIKLGTVDLRKIALPIIILILIVGAFNVYHEYNDIMDEWDSTLHVKEVTDPINNNNSVFVYSSTNKYCRFNEIFNNISEKYSGYDTPDTSGEIELDGLDLKYEKIVIPDYLREHPDKNVYVPMQDTVKPLHGDEYKFTSVGHVQHSHIYKVELV